jgi:hypothetical protein
VGNKNIAFNSFVVVFVCVLWFHQAKNGGTGPIWRPDMYFGNAVKFSGIGDKLGQHSEITPQGVVFWGRKMAATFMTQYHFQYFPFDKQSLPITRGVYRETNTEIRVSWDGPHAATIAADVQHPLFDIRSFDRRKKISKFFLGNYDIVQMHIRVQRSGENVAVSFHLSGVMSNC